MLYLLQNLEDIQPSTLKSISFSAIDLEGNGVDIAIDNGTLYHNGSPIGQSATGVMDGDTIKIELTSSATALATEYSVVRQQGIVQGIFSVSTVSDQLANVRAEFFDMEPYEVLPESGWVPSGVAEYNNLNTTMVPYNVRTIDQPDSSGSSSVRNILCDYHRDKVYFINVSTGVHFHTLDKYAGPASSADLFNDGFRFLTFIAYRKANKIVGYEDIFETLDIASTDPIKLQSQGKALFILEKGASQIRRLIFDPDDLSYTEDAIVYDEPILDFISNQYGVAVLHLNKLVDFNGGECPVTPAYKFEYNGSTDTFLITHRTEGAYSYTTGPNGSRVANRVISDLDYLSIAHAYKSQFYVLGEKGSLKVHANGTFTAYDSLDYPTFSLEEFRDDMFSSKLYTDIPFRVQSVDLEPNTIDLGEVEATPIGTTVYSNTVNIGGLEQPVQVKLPPLPSAKIKLLKNGIDTPAPTNVENGDTIQIEMEITESYKTAFLYPVTIGGDTFIFKILPIPGETLPRETAVPPVGTISTDDIDYVHSFALKMPLIEDSIYISTDKGVLYKNNVEVGTGANFNSSDTLNIHLPYQVYGVEYVTLTFGSDAYQSVVAFNEQPWNPAEGETSPISFNLVGLGPIGTNFDDRREGDWIRGVQEVLKTSPARVSLSGASSVDLEVPDIWKAQIYKNGVPSGRTVSVSHGDEVEFEMETTAVYDIQHLLPIIVQGVAQRYWNVYTEEDWYVEPFDLGLTDGHVITDYVVSNEITVAGLGSRVAVPLIVPYNTKLFINGVLAKGGNYNADQGGNTDYRGVLVEEEHTGFTPNVRNGDTVRLEGYPRPVYGTLQSYELTIGKTIGHWRVGLISVTPEVDSVSSHFAEVQLPVPEAAIDGPDSIVEVDLKPTAAVVHSNSPKRVTPAKVSKASVSSSAVVSSERRTGIAVSNAQVLSPKTESIPTSAHIELLDSMSGKKQETGIVLGEYFTAGSELLSSGIVLSETDRAGYVSTYDILLGDKGSYANFETDHREYVDIPNSEVAPNVEIKVETNRFDRFEAVEYLGNRHPIELRTYYPDKYAEHKEIEPGTFKLHHNAYIAVELSSQDLEPGVFPVRPDVTFIRDTQVWDNSNLPLIDPVYEVLPRNEDPLMTVEWTKLRLNPTIGYDPVYEIPARPDEASYTPKYEVVARPDEVKMATESIVIPRAFEVKLHRGAEKSTSNGARLVQGPTTAIHNKRGQFLQAQRSTIKSNVGGYRVLRSQPALSPAVVERKFGSNGDISIANTTVSDLRQTFLSVQDAKDNAEQVYGLSPDDYTVVDYENQYVWIRMIPCENMCYSCPDQGYIQGG